MSRTARRLIGAGCLAALVAAGVGLQAGPVKTIWVATLQGGGGDNNVFGPDDSFQYRPQYGHVNIWYDANKGGTPYSGFQLQMSYDKAPDGAFIGFRNLEAARSDIEKGLEPRCQFPAETAFDTDGFPVWNTDFGYGPVSPSSPLSAPTLWQEETWAGYALPRLVTTQTTSCIVDFLSGPMPGSGHKFPTNEWASVFLDLRVPNFNFLEMTIGDQATKQTGALWIAVYRRATSTVAACPMTADEVFFASVGFGPQTLPADIVIERVSETQWDVSYAVPSRVYEYVQGPAVTTTNKRGVTTSTCPTPKLIMATTTSPIKGHMIVAKVAQ